MQRQKLTIQFKSIVQLWNYAQAINCHRMEIIAAQLILICELSETDRSMLPKYEGLVVEDYHAPQKSTIAINK